MENSIAVDIDNVLSNTDFVIRNLIYREIGIKAQRKQITNWSYAKSLSITVDQERNVFQLFHERYCAYAPALPYAKESILRLSKKFSIHLLTARPSFSLELTKKWLASRGFPYSELSHVEDKSKLWDKYAFLIEDNGETAVSFARQRVPVVLFERPWNKSYVNPNIFRVSSWPMAIKMISSPLFVGVMKQSR